MNQRSVTYTLALYLCLGFSTTCLTGQVTFLTAREAKELVELAPDVAAARLRGECPTLSLFAPFYDTRIFSIQARGSCRYPGSPSSMLIDNYTVDRKTGTVTVYGSKSVVSTPAMQKKAKSVLELASTRLLSLAECRCIALEAANAEFSAGEERRLLSVRELGTSNDGWQGFLAEGQGATGRAVSTRLYSVNRETGAVWSEQTGSEVVSGGLGALRSRILGLRDPPAFSLEEALDVALRVPSLSARTSDRCSKAVATDFNSAADELYIGILSRCDGASNDVEVTVAVNILTGAVSDPRTQSLVPSTEAEQAGREILSKIKSVKLNERLVLESQCRASQ